MRKLCLFFTSLMVLSGCINGSNPAGFSGKLNVQLGYSEKDILVIVHVDDLGMHPDETEGALRTMEYGMSKTGSVMVVCPDFERTAEIYRETPGLDVGIHLTLNSEWKDAYTWSPLLPRERVPSLYNSKGVMWADTGELVQHMNPVEAAEELEAQIRKALDAGIKLTHMDAHMGSYLQNPALFESAKELSRKYNLPMVLWGHPDSSVLRRKGYVFPDTVKCIYFLEDEANDPDIRKQEYYRWMKSLQPGVHEIIIHAAHVTDALGAVVEMPYIRSGDYDVWTSAETKKLADELGIKFIGYRELQQLQARNWGLPVNG